MTPRFNLRQHDIGSIVGYILEVLQRRRGTHYVTVPANGSVRLWRAHEEPTNPKEIVGAYTRKTPAEVIAGDLQQHLEDIS